MKPLCGQPQKISQLQISLAHVSTVQAILPPQRSDMTLSILPCGGLCWTNPRVFIEIAPWARSSKYLATSGTSKRNMVNVHYVSSEWSQSACSSGRLGRTNLDGRPTRSSAWCGLQLAVVRLCWSYDQRLKIMRVGRIGTEGRCCGPGC